jgi:hypothetical protein
MKKIIDWLTHWGKDKILHDDLVCTISLLAACVCKLFISKDWDMITVYAFFSGFIAAICKEIYDEWKYKGSDERDWAADLCGLVRGTLFSLILAV